MGKDKKKWLSAYGVSLIVHIVFVGIIGAVVCITPTQKKEIVVEVTLDGGGGGGGGGGSRGKNLTESSNSDKQQINNIGKSALSEVFDSLNNSTDLSDLSFCESKLIDKETSSLFDEGSITGLVTSKGGGIGTGAGEGKGSGKGNGIGTGNGNGIGSGIGNGVGNGQGNGRGNGIGDGVGDGIGNGTGENDSDLVATKPIVIRSVSPIYPESRINDDSDVQRIVRLDIRINTDGIVSDAWVVESCGDAVLDQNALEAVMQWVFIPGKDKYGNPIECIMHLPLSFTIRDHNQ